MKPAKASVPEPPASLLVSRDEIERLSEADRAELRRYYEPSGESGEMYFIRDCEAVRRILARGGKADA